MSGNSLEEIRLVIENVKHNKIEGSLYLMTERMAWMAKQKDTISVSIPFVDIKSNFALYLIKIHSNRNSFIKQKKLNYLKKAQKISTEGKSKIQLQVVLHNDKAFTFHFISPSGPQKQLKDRDQVKDMLAALLPKYKQKISNELEEKKKSFINTSLLIFVLNLLKYSLIKKGFLFKIHKYINCIVI
jgi:transcription initiation factor TFIIH subunit 1